MASEWSAVRVLVGFGKVPLPKKKRKENFPVFSGD
jgi:hypothetical protein